MGIAGAGAIAFAVNDYIGESVTLTSKIIILLAMMLAGFIEGSILSYFQWKVLVTKFSKIPYREWFLYTVLVAVLGWFFGMLPSLFFMPQTATSGEVEATIDYHNPYIFLILSLSVGLVLGGIFGLFQWLLLRKYVKKAHQWIIANALGWGLGLLWIYIFASIPTEDSSLVFIILMGTIGGILTGLSVGVVTGYCLVKLEGK